MAYIGVIAMALIGLFILGVVNFAMHRAVLESGHPLLVQSPWFIHMLGGQIGLLVEFLMLLGCMLMAATGASAWAWGYLAYSCANGFTTWLILTRRV